MYRILSRQFLKENKKLLSSFEKPICKTKICKNQQSIDYIVKHN